ncbi:MAG: hypothetical protein EOM02_02110 [Synergistales bacterium]|nr:hypothetical protein [Synergistales bacterium]
MATIKIQSIRLDGDTQSRVSLDQNLVNEYSEAMSSGAKFPPIVVFDDGTDKWLADGFHRIYATRQAGLDEIDAEVKPGGLRDALLCSMKANATHGARRTNEDKRRAVKMAFKFLLEEGRSLDSITNVEVAGMAAVSEITIRRVREGIVLELDTKSTKSNEPNETKGLFKINQTSALAELARLQAEIDSLLTTKKENQTTVEYLRRKLAEKPQEIEVIKEVAKEVEVVKEVLPMETQERLKLLEAKEREATEKLREKERVERELQKAQHELNQYRSVESDLKAMEKKKARLEEEIRKVKEEKACSVTEITFTRIIDSIEKAGMVKTMVTNMAEEGTLTEQQLDRLSRCLQNLIAEAKDALIVAETMRPKALRGGGIRVL